MNEFDLKAKDWDKNQLHLERTKVIAHALKKAIRFEKHMHVLEYGAGTALLSFELKHLVHKITLMDNAMEMVRIMKSKTDAGYEGKMFPVFYNLEEHAYPETFDVIYSQMVFHHVHHTEIVLQRFYEMLNPGGYLAIADLYPEDGSFHGADFTGHQGFDPAVLGEKLISIGYSEVTHAPCHTISKVVESGDLMNFPVFLLTARKT